ncbi:MAG: energy transducer TonB [Pseudomonadota bacterium]
MSAHAYSESYAHDRRHARHVSRHHTAKTTPQKSADIIQLVPRSVKIEKPIELVYSKYRRLTTSALTAAIVGLHLAVLSYFLYQPIAEAAKKIEAPVIKLERYTPPVIPPQQITPELPKPIKKQIPKVVEPEIVRDNPNVVEEFVPPVAVSETPTAPVEEVTQPSATANYLHNPAPIYPAQAEENGWGGTVTLSVLVQPDGTAKTIEVKQSSGKKVLDQAAIQAVQRWTFVPAKQGETAVEGWVEVPITFTPAN